MQAYNFNDPTLSTNYTEYNTDANSTYTADGLTAPTEDRQYGDLRGDLDHRRDADAGDWATGNLTLTGAQSVTNGFIQLDGGSATVTDTSGLTIGANALLSGAGTVNASIGGTITGTVEAIGGTLDLTGPTLNVIAGAPTGWSVDRDAPAGFANVGSAFGMSNVLALSIGTIAAADAFDDYQGEYIPVSGGQGTVIDAQLYVPSNWANRANGSVGASLWAEGTGGDE